MTDTAPANSQTASPVVLPSVEDKKWAGSLANRLHLTMFRGKADSIMMAELVRTIENKEVWRLNHLLTTEFGFGTGRTYRTDPNAGPSSASYYNLKGAERERLYKHHSYSSLITLALDLGFRDGAKLLVERGASPFTARKDNGQTLRSVVKKGESEFLLALMARASSADGKTREEMLGSVLYETITVGKTDMLKAVTGAYPGILDVTAYIADGGYYNAPRNPYSALDLAVRADASPEAAEYVVTQRKETEKTKIESGAALAIAIRNGNDAAAAAVINAGSPVGDNAKGFSPIMEAAAATLPKTVALLIEKGADAEFKATSGPQLLKAALTTRKKEGQTWGDIAATAEVLMEKLPISAFDIRELMEQVPAETVAYKKMKARAFTLDPKGEDMGDTWRALGAQQVGIVTRDKDSGLQLTEVFNFATKEHMIVSRNLETKADTILLRETFEETRNKLAVAEAEKFLPKAKATPAPAQPKAA